MATEPEGTKPEWPECMCTESGECGACWERRKLEGRRVIELPGSPGPSLEGIWGALTNDERAALRPHLLGETSADWLAAVLKQHGHQVSASTIRTYRRALRQTGV